MKKFFQFILIPFMALVTPTAIDAAESVYLLGEVGLDGDNEDPNRQVGYRPDTGIAMQSNDGNTFTATVHFWNTAGSATHNFGFCTRTTLASDPTAWSEINDYRIGASAANTAIGSGGTFEIGEQGSSRENAFVAQTGTYFISLNLSAKTLTCKKIEPIWILGEMGLDGDNQTSSFATSFIYNRGIRMTSADGVNYSATVHFWSKDGKDTHNFGFLQRNKLGSSWDEIAAYRFAAVAPETTIESGKTYAVGALESSKENFFKAPTGTYKLTLNLDKRTLTAVSADRDISSTPTLWLLGEVGLDGDNENPAQQITFRPDKGVKFSTNDGRYYFATVHFWKSDGSATSNFGLCKSYGLANNTGDWESINPYRIGASAANTKITSGTTYPLGAIQASKENFFVVDKGTYHIVVDLESNTICLTRIEPLWLLGEVGLDGLGQNPNSQVGYRPDVGIRMSSTDGVNYSANVYFWDSAGVNATHNFGLCTKRALASSATAWDEIAAYRIGALSGNVKIDSGTTYPLGATQTSKENFFQAPTGAYLVEVNMQNRTIRCTASPRLWILGEMGLDGDNEDPAQQIGFRPDKGIAMTSSDGKTYTARVHFWNIKGDALHNFGLCYNSGLATSQTDWNAIASNRIGATETNTPVIDGVALNLGANGSSKENFFQIPTGTWDITVDMVSRTITCSRAATLSNDYWDTYSDTWVAVDELNRTVNSSDTGVDAPHSNRTVGMFYYICNGPHGTEGDPIYDITEILKANPSNPQFGAEGKPHWWARPWLGYYENNDQFAINKHLQMIVDAGIDLIFFDVTNAFTYDDTVRMIMRIIDARTAAGLRSPKLCYTVNAGATNVVRHLYNNFYANPENKKYWYYYQGKPLMLVDPDALSELELGIKNHFSMRHCWAWMADEANNWGWLENYPQRVGWGYDANGNRINEQISVATAQHASTKIGKSYHNGSQPAFNQYAVCSETPKGLYFEEQWSRAHAVNPPLVMVTQFNECMAARFTAKSSSDFSQIRPGGASKIGESIFVDLYSAEFNRDIEPSTHPLIRDNYYMQLVSHVRKYKGARSIPTPSAAKSIQFWHDTDVWDDVFPEYRDDKGDILHRNTLGFQKVAPMTNTTGRNDIKLAKVAKDKNYVSFYVETVDPISDFETSDNWMTLLINSDCNYTTGWSGYDYAVMKHNGDYCLMRNQGNRYCWTKICSVRYTLDGNALYFAIEKAKAGLSGDVDFDFKWADNTPANPDILDFIDKGDVAPNGRFNYRYKGSKVSSKDVEIVSDVEMQECAQESSIAVRRLDSQTVEVSTGEPTDVYLFNFTGAVVGRYHFNGSATLPIPRRMQIIKIITPKTSKAIKIL